ncbi:MAG: dTDP-glucose 4,6-dehydratase [Sporomusaceae bacterium]|nr:dTDP-glucose 4,6-dehydratase [Sporomusaceae bacterium]
MKTVLITGGAGFIGSNLVRYLLTRDETRIINLDNLTYAGNLASLEPIIDHPRHRFVKGAIQDRLLLSQLLQQSLPDAVIHLAAESHVDRSIDGPAAFVDTNIVGSFQLLDCVKEYWLKLRGGKKETFRFLQVSTDEVYGELGAEGYFSEQSNYAPRSPYSASKAAADHLAKAYFHTYGLPVLITNCSNNYGPYQFPEKLIPLTICNALANKPLPLYGDGTQIRDWLFVLDHCRAIERVLERGCPGESYAIGGGCEKTNREMVDTLCSLLDQKAPSPSGSYRRLIRFVSDRPGHDRRYAIDAGKIKRQLGWQALETFTGGLEQTVDWYLDNAAWCRQVKADAAAKSAAKQEGVPE